LKKDDIILVDKEGYKTALKGTVFDDNLPHTQSGDKLPLEK
jgi:hypothetical protein